MPTSKNNSPFSAFTHSWPILLPNLACISTHVLCLINWHTLLWRLLLHPQKYVSEVKGYTCQGTCPPKLRDLQKPCKESTTPQCQALLTAIKQGITYIHNNYSYTLLWCWYHTQLLVFSLWQFLVANITRIMLHVLHSSQRRLHIISHMCWFSDF